MKNDNINGCKHRRSKRLILRRLISTALTAALTLTGFAASAAFSFADSKVSADSDNSVNAAENAGMVLSSDALTRSEFIKLLAEKTGADISSSRVQAPFTDVKADDSYINWAYSQWLINGSSDTSFRPDAPITAQEAWAIISRYLDYMYTALPAYDKNAMPEITDLSSWAADDAAKCSMYSIISPDENIVSARSMVSADEAEAWITAASAFSQNAIVQAEQNTFADSLVRNLKTEGSWSVSPYSIRMCLAMLANGAKGETQQELLAALKIDDIDQFNADVKNLLETYDGYQKIMSLNTANSIWINQSWFDGKGRFLENFSNLMTDIYRAETLEVTNDNSVEKVNEWVNEKTNGKIPSILTESNREFVTALINAVYFKAAWANEFNEALTDKDSFTNADGSVSETDFMHKTDSLGYYSTPGVEAVKLDYKKYSVDSEEGDNFEYFSDADFSMYLIKNDKQLDIENLLNQADFINSDVQLSIPKFKVEYDAELDDTLKALGITTAYNQEKADFSNIIDPTALPYGQYFLDTVLHKTYISIDEKGTEAAAVTAALNDASSALQRMPQLRVFTANEPFYFAIRDNQNKEILFFGRYEAVK